jgi:hypothetical protein
MCSQLRAVASYMPLDLTDAAPTCLPLALPDHSTSFSSDSHGTCGAFGYCAP